jgi:hypothetical protein
MAHLRFTRVARSQEGPGSVELMALLNQLAWDKLMQISL